MICWCSTKLTFKDYILLLLHRSAKSYDPTGESHLSCDVVVPPADPRVDQVFDRPRLNREAASHARSIGRDGVILITSHKLYEYKKFLEIQEPLLNPIGFGPERLSIVPIR